MKYAVLKMARDLAQPFRPVEIADLDGAYHAFIVRYSGDYIPHSHSADEFVYILEGELEVVVDGVSVPLRQGEALKVPAHVVHRPRCKGMALGMVFETKGLQIEKE
jgi:mannose-6-phosphate isomerase-like protein (cupin superfamily)